MAKRKVRIFPFPVIPGTEVTRKETSTPSWLSNSPHHDIPYRAPEKAVEDYGKFKRAKEFWENEGLESKFSEKYLDARGRYIHGGDVTRYKNSAVRRAGELEDPSVHSRFWAPEENIDDTYRRQKGRKPKVDRKRRKIAKKKMSGKRRKKANRAKKKSRQRSNTY